MPLFTINGYTLRPHRMPTPIVLSSEAVLQEKCPQMEGYANDIKCCITLGNKFYDVTMQ